MIFGVFLTHYNICVRKIYFEHTDFAKIENYVDSVEYIVLNCASEVHFYVYSRPEREREFTVTTQASCI